MLLGEEFQININQLTNHYITILLCYKTHKGICVVTEPIGIVRIGVNANKKEKRKKGKMIIIRMTAAVSLTVFD